MRKYHKVGVISCNSIVFIYKKIKNWLDCTGHAKYKQNYSTTASFVTQDQKINFIF